MVMSFIHLSLSLTKHKRLKKKIITTFAKNQVNQTKRNSYSPAQSHYYLCKCWAKAIVVRKLEIQFNVLV